MGDLNETLFLQLLKFCQVLRENLQGVFTVTDNEEVREEKVPSNSVRTNTEHFWVACSAFELVEILSN